MRALLLAILLAGCGGGGVTRVPSGPTGRVEGVAKGPGVGVANVFVCLTAGEPAAPVAETEVLVVLGRDGNATPRVVVLRAGQTLSIQNDGPAHSLISIEPLKNRRQIFSLMAGSGLGGMPFERGEFAIPIRCADHPDGHGWIHVVDHPFFAVTDAEGKFAIEGLRPGSHEFFAWHEGAPSTPLRATTRVEPGGTATLDFHLK
jgi:hypothetical protein